MYRAYSLLDEKSKVNGYADPPRLRKQLHWGITSKGCTREELGAALLFEHSFCCIQHCPMLRMPTSPALVSVKPATGNKITHFGGGRPMTLLVEMLHLTARAVREERLERDVPRESSGGIAFGIFLVLVPNFELYLFKGNALVVLVSGRM